MIDWPLNVYFSLLQEPMFLEHCVVAVDPDYDEVFELQDMAKESYLFKVGITGNKFAYWPFLNHNTHKRGLTVLGVFLWW